MKKTHMTILVYREPRLIRDTVVVLAWAAVTKHCRWSGLLRTDIIFHKIMKAGNQRSGRTLFCVAECHLAVPSHNGEWKSPLESLFTGTNPIYKDSALMT